MSGLPVDVSTSEKVSFALIVDDVDFELRLVEDQGQGQAPIFDASKGQQGRRCKLLVDADYVLRYNNNDGGPGVLHFRVLEIGTQEVVRKEVNIGAVVSPIVLEFQIKLRPNPSLSPA